MPTLKAVPKYNLCVGIKKLEALGSGFPLFYSFKLFTMIVMFVLFLLQGIYTMIIALWRSRGEEWITGEGTPPFIALITVGALGKDPENYEGWELLVLVGIVTVGVLLVLVLSIVLRRYQHNVETGIDERNITPTDFTVFVTNIPLKVSEEELKEYFQKIFSFCNVVNVNYTYDIKDVVKWVRVLDSLQAKRNFVLKYKE